MIEEAVFDMVKNLWAHADATHSLTHVRTAATKTCWQKLENKIEKNHEELKKKVFSKSHQYRSRILISNTNFPQIKKESTPHVISYNSSCVIVRNSWKIK